MKLKYSDESLYAKDNGLQPCVWLWDATLGGVTKAVCVRVYRDGCTNGTARLKLARLKYDEVIAPAESRT
jgi:hypothetical protein